MKRIAIGLVALLGIIVLTATAEAQSRAQSNEATQDSADDSDDPNEPMAGTDTKASGAARPAATVSASRYDDIVVVPRKVFLKSNRWELAPLAGMSINDNMIRHFGLGGDITYFLTEVFGVGLQGMYMNSQRTERESLTGLQFNRITTLNRALWQAALNFSYVPIHGKFAMFNRYIFHWESYASAGVGMMQTEIIPRRRGDETFKNEPIVVNFGLGFRLYLGKWMTVNIALRDYAYNDKFERPDRRESQPIAEVESQAQSKFMHNVMVYTGVGFYLPPSFSYRTPR